MKTKPVFKHDCDNCQFLGHAVIDGKAADFYVCEHRQPGHISETDNRNMNDLIYRHSDEPGDYGCTWVGYCTPLSAFAVLALALYVRHLGCNGANSMIKGTFSMGDKVVLNLNK